MDDFEAVTAYPLVRVVEGVKRFIRQTGDARWEANADFAESLDGARSAAPHLESSETLDLSAAWRLLAVSGALRDCHFPDAIRSFERNGATDPPPTFRAP